MTVAEEAQRLVDEGRIGIIHSTCLYTQAFVRREGGYYNTAVYRSGHFSCTCNWGRTHSHTDAFCAHALAVKLAVEREKAT